MGRWSHSAILITLTLAISSIARAGVTHLTSIANETEHVVEMRDFEDPNNKGHNATVPAGKTLGIEQIDCSIPWADSQQHLDEGKYIRIKLTKTDKDGSTKPITIYIWQSKGSVRYSKELVHDLDAPAVPGVGTEDGRRKIVIGKDGSFEFFKID